MLRLASTLSVLLLLAVASGARADPAVERVEGTVVAGQARWTSDHRIIVTESVVRRDDGSEVVLRQRGGTVDGIGMRTIPAPPLLVVGQRVVAEAWPIAAPHGRATHQLLRVAALAPASGAPLGPPPPFVRTESKFGTALHWAASCVYITYDAAGTSEVQGNDEFPVMDAVLERWRTDTQACSYFTFVMNEPDDGEVGYDGVNRIKFRDTSWCRPAIGDDPMECYDHSAAALTNFSYVEDDNSDRDGELLDADIELNGVDFMVSIDGTTDGCPGAQKADLANTLTHEVGHLMGLGHTCWDGKGNQPTDGNGDLVPSCFPESSLSDEIKDATMYNFERCGETKKISPEPDDVAAICDAYPLADDPGFCEPVDIHGKTGCCAVAPGGSRPARTGLGAGLLALLGIAWLRRRGRFPRPS